MYKESAWKLLRQLAAGEREKVVNLVHLRNIASRARPPAELCAPDLGTRGPILGTIHASKGREANTVVLVLPPSQNGSQRDSLAAELEEGRVYYVGATRAREALATARKGVSRACYLDSRRVYRILPSIGKGPPRVQLEVGREGDAHRLAHLGWRSSGEVQRALADSVRLPLPLKGVCRREQDFKYRLVLEQKTRAGATREIEIGQMGEAFHHDLRQIWSRIDTDGRLRPGDTVNFLYLVGATTVALSDSERTAVRPPYSRSGFALAPVVKGLALVKFPYRKPGRPSC